MAFGISALLFSGALQVKREEYDMNTARAAAPAQQAEVLANCDMAAFALSPKRVELMSFCSRRLIQTAALQVSACFALLDAIQVADWRAARSLFRWQRDCQRSPTLLSAKRSAWLSLPIG